MSKSKTILIVEDEEDLVDLYQLAIAKAGNAQIQTCDNYPEALSRVSNQRYDLIICDIRLKKGLGTDLVKKIRSEKKSPNFKSPIIIVSGHLDANAVDSLKGQIQWGFVKPFTIEDLASKTAELLKTPSY